MESNGDMLSSGDDTTGTFYPVLPVSLIGYKTARIKMVDGQIMLSALAVPTPIPFDAAAQCDIWTDAHEHYQQMVENSPADVAQILPQLPLEPPHEVPSEACTCGFYAYSQPDSALNHEQNDSRCVMLEVAISGQYLEYENGYRYAHQRVKKVVVGGCMVCSAPPTSMNITDEGWMRGVCNKHRNGHSFTLNQMSTLASAQIKDSYAPVEFVPGLLLQPQSDLMSDIMQLDMGKVIVPEQLRHSVLPLILLISTAVISVGGLIALFTS